MRSVVLERVYNAFDGWLRIRRVHVDFGLISLSNGLRQIGFGYEKDRWKVNERPLYAYDVNLYILVSLLGYASVFGFLWPYFPEDYRTSREL